MGFLPILFIWIRAQRRYINDIGSIAISFLFFRLISFFFWIDIECSRYSQTNKIVKCKDGIRHYSRRWLKLKFDHNHVLNPLQFVFLPTDYYTRNFFDSSNTVAYAFLDCGQLVNIWSVKSIVFINLSTQSRWVQL